MATNRKPVYRGPIVMLLAVVKTLRIWESQWRDLSYGHDDPRAAMADAEQPHEVIIERDYLRREVVRTAALVGGETGEAAIMFADTPLSPSNPYNLERVREAVAIFTGERF